MVGGDLGDGLVEAVVVLRLGDACRGPTNGASGEVTTRVRCDANRFAVPGVEIDLDRPAEFGYREIESGFAVAGQVDVMLAHEASNSGSAQCVGDAHFGVRLGGAARQSAVQCS